MYCLPYNTLPMNKVSSLATYCMIFHTKERPLSLWIKSFHQLFSTPGNTIRVQCCLLMPGLKKDIQRLIHHHTFNLQIAKSDRSPHVKWVSAWWLYIDTLVFLRICVSMCRSHTHFFHPWGKRYNLLCHRNYSSCFSDCSQWSTNVLITAKKFGVMDCNCSETHLKTEDDFFFF